MAAESFQLEICKEIKKVSSTKAPLAVYVNYEIVELRAVFLFQQKSTELSAACIWECYVQLYFSVFLDQWFSNNATQSCFSHVSMSQSVSTDISP